MSMLCMHPWNEFGVNVYPEKIAEKSETDQSLLDETPLSIMSDC